LVARTLITTAKENTWPDDKNKPVLFLGEWCKLYQRKILWQDLNSKTAIYHWNDRKKLLNDYKLLMIIYEFFLVQLSSILNKTHNTNHSIKYWRILIGPWLGMFVQVAYDRWFMLKKVIEDEEIDHCIVTKADSIDKVSNDLKEFENSIKHDYGNELIYGQLLEMCWQDKINIEFINDNERYSKKINNSTWQEKIDKEISSGFKNVVKQWLRKLVLLFNKFFPKDDGYFFISSYLPLLSDLKLQVRLGQFPKLWRVPITPPANLDMNFRQWSIDIKNYKVNSFESVLARLIPQHMPKIYLEGYDDLKSASEMLPWPSKPKAIFTGTLWFDSEVFKIWAAGKSENRIPFVIGQHGGHFGTSPFASLEDHQIKISDKWISWGWSDYSRPKVTPIGNLKGFGLSAEYNPKGGALMVECTVPRYSYHLYAIVIAGQFLDYFEDQKTFLNSLQKTLREQVTVRASNNDFDWDLPSRFNDLMPEVEVDPGNQDIRKLIKKSRIYISTYNATTYLESMSWNIPTIIFWNESHWELKEDIKPYFELLKSVGIFHNTPEGAAKHMTNIWDNVDDWWFSDSVQNVRITFCNQFSKIPKDPLKELEFFFKEL